MARVPIRPETDKSSDPMAEIIEETISGRMRHFSMRRNRSPSNRRRGIKVSTTDQSINQSINLPSEMAWNEEMLIIASYVVPFPSFPSRAINALDIYVIY